MAADANFDPEAILRGLNRHAVRYVVVGGFAVAAHGVVRATADLDLVVERSWENAGRLGSALEEMEAVDATGEKTPPIQEALVRRTDRLFDTVFGRLHILHALPGVPDYGALLPPLLISLGGETIPVATLADLRRMKESAGRLKDRADLAELDALGNAASGE
jgi:hypothetical protein